MPKPAIVAAHRLADILERENLALTTMDLAKATALLPEKTQAITELTQIEPVPVTSAPEDLVATVRRLEGLTSENRRLLQRAIAAQQRVIGIVVSAAASVAAEPAYGTGRHATIEPMALRTRA